MRFYAGEGGGGRTQKQQNEKESQGTNKEDGTFEVEFLDLPHSLRKWMWTDEVILLLLRGRREE